LQRIGDRGELIVLALERQRLMQAGKMKLAEDVEHVSQRDDSLGFDILSFDDDGTKRQIEVKATTSECQKGFYITANELESSEKLQNYYLYLIFSAMSKSPRIYRIKRPNLRAAPFHLQPFLFRGYIAGPI
jgi:hypothetical protein